MRNKYSIYTGPYNLRSDLYMPNLARHAPLAKIYGASIMYKTLCISSSLQLNPCVTNSLTCPLKLFFMQSASLIESDGSSNLQSDQWYWVPSGRVQCSGLRAQVLDQLPPTGDNTVGWCLVSALPVLVWSLLSETRILQVIFPKTYCEM